MEKGLLLLYINGTELIVPAKAAGMFMQLMAEGTPIRFDTHYKKKETPDGKGDYDRMEVVTTASIEVKVLDYERLALAKLTTEALKQDGVIK
jgi:hypothetical protein